MKKILLAMSASVILTGCWTFNESAYPETAVTAATSAAKEKKIQITGFEMMLTEYEAVSGFQTVYVPGHFGHRHYHPGYYETVPTMTMVQQNRPSDIMLRRAQDEIEKAGFTLAATDSDVIVDAQFEGPYISSDDSFKQAAWVLGTVFFCNYRRATWSAKLRIRETKTSKLIFHHDYTQDYQVNVFGLIPLFGIASCDATDTSRMRGWALAALTDRMIADTTAFLSK